MIFAYQSLSQKRKQPRLLVRYSVLFQKAIACPSLPQKLIKNPTYGQERIATEYRLLFRPNIVVLIAPSLRPVSFFISE